MVRDYSIPLTELSFDVLEMESGCRLDQFLHMKMPHRSRSFFKKHIREGFVDINGQTRRPSFQVKYRDKIKFKIKEQAHWIDPLSVPLDILFEDEELVAVNKAAWQLVHPTGHHQSGTVLNALHARHLKNGGDQKNLPRVLHRLDQETSGVLLFAKGNCAGHFGQLFEKRQTKKIYLALLEGDIQEPFECHEPIGKNDDHVVSVTQCVRSDGKAAHSFFYPLGCLENKTLCAIKIETGRLHQIRVHAAHLGHAVMGDPLYNSKDQDFERWIHGQEPHPKKQRPKRQLLHAYQLEISPTNRKKLKITAPLPEDFRNIAPRLINSWDAESCEILRAL